MVYLLYGLKDFYIDKKIKELQSDINPMDINKYDLNYDQVKDVLIDCETYSFFSEKRLIICENAFMFSHGNNKDDKLIENYLNNINPNTIVLFILRAEKIDSRKKIVKLVKKNGIVCEFNDVENISSYVANLFKGFNIKQKDVNFFINRVGDNPLILEKEAEKILLFKGDNKTITEDDIISLTAKKVDVDIFKLIDDIVKNNKESAIEIYKEMLKNNEEPIKIVIMLANQFRLMYQAKGLLKKGYSEKDIASILKVHPYRVKLAIVNGRKYTEEKLLKFLYELANIDLGIKSGRLNKDIALELFILK